MTFNKKSTSSKAKPKAQRGQKTVASKSTADRSNANEYDPSTLPEKISTLSLTTDHPDFSIVSDASIVVLLKNLTKKHDVTKEKSLLDLQEWFSTKSEDELEEGVLAAWSNLYPRLSIDNALRVRQLAHQTLGIVASRGRERFAAYQNQIVGCWLAGLYDTDRQVSQAAGESLRKVYDSQIKIRQLWKDYQKPILDYWINSILHERVETLSDVRNSTPADMEAKYARVVSGGLLSIGHLITSLKSETDEFKDDYLEFIQQPRLWLLANHPDLTIRRAIYGFLRSCLLYKKSFIEPSLRVIAQAMIGRAMNMPQSGSSIYFLEALVLLTETFPNSWLLSSTSKESGTLSRTFCGRYIKRGSQGAPSAFWDKLYALVVALPKEVFPNTIEQANEYMLAVSSSLESTTEFRGSRPEAWQFYFKLAFQLLTSDGLGNDQKKEFIINWCQSVFQQHIRGIREDKALFRVSDNSAEITAKGFDVMSRTKDNFVVRTLEETWTNLRNESLTEVTEVAAQEQPMNILHQWSLIFPYMYRLLPKGSWQYDLMRDNNTSLLDDTTKLVLRTMGRNPQLSNAVKELSQALSKVREQDDSTEALMQIYVTNTIPDLLETPSKVSLLQTLVSYAMHWDSPEALTEGWQRVMGLLLEKEDDDSIVYLLKATNERSLEGKIPAVPELERTISIILQDTLQGKSTNRPLLKSVFTASPSSFSNNFTTNLLNTITSSLNVSNDSESDEDKARQTCILLNEIPLPSLVAFILSKSEEADSLLRRTLVLTESTNESLASTAEKLLERLNGALKTNTVSERGEGLKKVVASLQAGVVSSHENAWLSVDSLIVRAMDITNKSKDSEKESFLSDILFPAQSWNKHLNFVFNKLPARSLGSLQPLGVCIYLVTLSEETVADEPIRDDIGLPVVVRMAIFITQLLKSSNIKISDLAKLTAGSNENKVDQTKVTSSSNNKINSLLYSLVVLREIISDCLMIPYQSSLIPTGGSDHNGMLVELMNDIDALSEGISMDINEQEHLLILGLDTKSKYNMSSVLQQLFKSVETDPSSCSAYYHGRALATQLAIIRNKCDPSPELLSEWINKLNMRKTDNCLLSTAMLYGLTNDSLRSSKPVIKLRDELINDLSGIKAANALHTALPKLAILNETWTSEENVAKIPQNRAVLFLKNILSWFDDEVSIQNPDHASLVCVVCSTLSHFLHQLGTVYGGFWGTIFDLLNSGFDGSSEVSEDNIFIQVCLFRVLGSMKEIRAVNLEKGLENDDLAEAYDASFPELQVIWLRILEAFDDSDKEHEPYAEANRMLERNLANISLSDIEDPDELYHLLGLESASIQGAAFNILHRYIPSAQEQISIDAALSKDDMFTLQLQPELLSLVLEVPVNSKKLWYKSPASELENVSRSLKGYLLTWNLIFDHFENSSFKVKVAYIDDLKEGDYISILLNFVFDFLGHSRGRPIDGSKYPIEGYRIESRATSLDPDDLTSLMVYTYYQSLRFTPSLSKAWFNECNNRQTIQYVEAFTEKYISPTLLNVEFAAINHWLDDPQSRPDGLNVTVSKTVREVKATYDVDDQTMEMMVKLPTSFPLHLVEVKGTKRVAVSEKQWGKWLLACQAVIALQSGSIVDGLVLFQRNVKLHLENVEECAICYSILSTVEKTLPSKACATCKRKFHGSCLLKWFKSSSSSSCPLCRSAFQFS